MSITSKVQGWLIKRQLSQLPPEAREMFEKMYEKNPELLMAIAGEMKKQTDKGKDQMEAMMVVMQKHGDKIRQLQMMMKK